jgi:hypothetical protein
MIPLMIFNIKISDQKIVKDKETTFIFLTYDNVFFNSNLRIQPSK